MATYSEPWSNDSRYLTLIDVASASYNSLTNLSVVSWKAYLRKTAGGGFHTTDKVNPYSVAVGGTTVTSGEMAYDFSKSTPADVLVGSGTVTVYHDVHGAGECRGTHWFADYRNGLGSATATGLLTLTKLNRVGYMQGYPSTAILNNGFTFTTKKRSNGLTYTVGLVERDSTAMLTSWTTVTEEVSTTYKISEADKATVLAYLQKTASSDTVRLCLRTRSGSTEIGRHYVNVSVKALSYLSAASSIIAIRPGYSVSFTITTRSLDVVHDVSIYGTDGQTLLTAQRATVAGSSQTFTLDDADVKLLDAYLQANSSDTVRFYVRTKYNGTTIGWHYSDMTASSRGYATGTPSTFVANDGFNIRVYERSNNLTYQISMYTENNGQVIMNYRAILPGASRNIQLTASELNVFYNLLTSTAAMKVRINVRTMLNNFIIGLEMYDLTCSARAPVVSSYTNVANIGDYIYATWVPSAGVLTHQMAMILSTKNVWVPGTKTYEKGMTTGWLSVTPENTINAIIGENINTSVYNIWLIIRSYNESGVTIATTWLPLELTLKRMSILRNYRYGMTMAEMDVWVSGNVLPVRDLGFSLDNGDTYTSLQSVLDGTYMHVMKNLVPGRAYKIFYRAAHKGHNVYSYSSSVNFVARDLSTLEVTPNPSYGDAVIRIVTTKSDPSITNASWLGVLEDSVGLAHSTNYAAQTHNYQLTPSYFDPYYDSEGETILRMKISMSMATIQKGAVQATVYKDIRILQNGTVYVRRNGLWVTSDIRVRTDDSFLRAVPYVLRNNVIPSEGLEYKSPYWVIPAGVSVQIDKAPPEAFEDGYVPNLVPNSTFEAEGGYQVSAEGIRRVKRGNNWIMQMSSKGNVEDVLKYIILSAPNRIVIDPTQRYSMQALVYLDSVENLEDPFINVGIILYDNNNSLISDNTLTINVDNSTLKRGWNLLKVEDLAISNTDAKYMTPRVQLIRNGEINVYGMKVEEGSVCTTHNKAWADYTDAEKTLYRIRSVGGAEVLKMYARVGTHEGTNGKTFHRSHKVRNVGTGPVHMLTLGTIVDVPNDGVLYDASTDFAWDHATLPIYMHMRTDAIDQNLDIYTDQIVISELGVENNWVKVRR